MNVSNKGGTLHFEVSQSAGTNWVEWQEKLGGNIYHSMEWAEINTIDNQQPLYLNWLNQDGQSLGIAVGVKSWSRIPLAGRFMKHLAFESYPAVKDNSSRLAREILQQIVDYVKKEGYLTLSVNSYLTDIAVDNCEQMGFVSLPRIEFVLDLALSDNDLFKCFATRHKRNVKKARKHDLVFKEADSMEAMREFRKLQVQSRDRRIKRGEDIGMLNDSYYEELGKSYFKEKLGRVFLMTSEGQAVSAAFVSIYGGRAYYVYGGSSDDGFRMNAPPLLFLNIFSRCRELGCREFNMGGVPASAVERGAQSHGLYMFKAGFGGKEINCYSLSADNLRPILNSFIKITKKAMLQLASK